MVEELPVEDLVGCFGPESKQAIVFKLVYEESVVVGTVKVDWFVVAIPYFKSTAVDEL